MKNLIIFLPFLALILTLNSCSGSKTAGSGPAIVKLGERVVDFRADHDVMPVTAGKGTFSAIRFTVRRAPVHVLNIRVNYMNGESQNITVGRRIAPGTTSRWLDLPGAKRAIRDIRFNYKTGLAGRTRALIEVVGRR